MTDSRLENNNTHNQNSSCDSKNHNNSKLTHISYSKSNYNNNNNEGVEESNYQHKKFKKMSSGEISFNLTSNVTQILPSESSVFQNESSESIIELKLSNNCDITKLRKYSYTCPHCKLSCRKPSVLQKHMRAHTNERPFPCVLCGFAFKTKSNLFKHFKSRAHISKKSGDLNKVSHFFNQASDDSDVSLPDTASNGTSNLRPFSIVQPASLTQAENLSICSPNISPRSSLSSSPCSSPTSNDVEKNNTKIVKIYKPKFHVTRKNCVDIKDVLQIKQPQEYSSVYTESVVTDNQTIVDKPDSRVQELIECKKNSTLLKSTDIKSYYNTRNCTEHFVCPDCNLDYGSLDSLKTHRHLNCNKYLPFGLQVENLSQSSLASDCMNIKIYDETINKRNVFNEDGDCHPVNIQPMSSPGPLLGNTRLVDSQCQAISVKRAKLETSTEPHSCKELKKILLPNALRMFGGHVCILNKDDENETIRIESKINHSSNKKSSCQSNAETASVVVRSSLHSGGTMLHKSSNAVISLPYEQSCTRISLANIVPNISPPSLAPSISSSEIFKPSNVLYAGKIVPHVPGIPGPHCLTVNYESTNINKSSSVSTNIAQIKSQFTTAKSIVNSSNSASVSKFLRPCSLPLKPGTYIPKQHHGITPTTNTLSLISPETPRPKKSYGQLYLNGHSYTYLGLKCSTRLFYCTLNRTQPMYVAQQNGLSMYSNWRICKEAPADFELSYYDSRHRLTGYTLASDKHTDILTHSSWRPHTSSNSDSSHESDREEKKENFELSVNKLKYNKDCTYGRGKGSRRFICNQCGIRCKKPSMLKKHMKMHTDVRIYTCQNCSSSFRSKSNLTKHIKSRSQYRKCKNVKEKNLNQATKTVNTTKDAKMHSFDENKVETELVSETESEGSISKESKTEECEIAQDFFSLSKPRERDFPGLFTLNRPITYPYDLCTRLSLDTPFQNQPIVLNFQEKNHPSCETFDCDNNIHNFYKKQDATISPIDLTIKSPYSIIKRTKSINILASLSDPALLNSIVQTMECIPSKIQTKLTEQPINKEMLQAYLTERYMKDNKVKEQYRVFHEEKISLKESSHLISSDLLRKTVVNQENKLTNLEYLEKLNQKVMSKQSKDYNLEYRTSFSSKHQENFIANLPSDRSLQNIEYKSITLETSDDELSNPRHTSISLDPSNSESISKIESNITEAKKLQSPIQKNVADFRDSRSVSLSNMTEMTLKSDLIQPIIINPSYLSITDDTRNVCNICNKVFNKQSQLRLHTNIHYFERPFRCESCGISFRTKGHLLKHERSTLHHNKVNMTSTFGAATSTNPRPFKCTDCKSAFRIHGHLAKHLRSKMHIMKLECLRKLPFGTYAEMERSSVSLNDIDTSDCNTSLISLQSIAKKLCQQNPSQLVSFEAETIINEGNSTADSSSDDERDFSITKPQSVEDKNYRE
ncbi:uncharacterized protein LOC106644347 [Copidosoma floridanum]|uniref:uncharacterized protein LOC106644347 n=1 Tax=Copidosoma floridanum TaxID=29053 RepID=UPI0006C9958C|nr:uncharacterized protein LOC106644347 [Copidosoma floridanum]